MLAIIVAILIATAVWTVWGNTAPKLTRIAVTSDRLPEAFSGYRIAQVSDLHNAELGEANARLINMLREAAPDIIVMTGDMVDSRHTRLDVTLNFARAAASIAPCYYATGNHESRIGEYEKFEAELIGAGVSVLRGASTALERGGETVTLMGIDDPSFARDGAGFGETSTAVSDEISQLLEGVQGYSILLCHRPELFDVYCASGVDLVFCGHTHGGQARLPFIGGLVAPNQGLFPKYDAGLYAAGGTGMIVSRGLGNSIIPLRFNNRPEVVLAELRRK